MNYTFPLNKQDLMVGEAVSILWQCLELDDDSKIIKDNQKSLSLLITKLCKENATAGKELQKVASSFAVAGSPRVVPPCQIAIDTPAARLLNTIPPSGTDKHKSTRKHLQAIASRFSTFNAKDSKAHDSQKKRTLSPYSAATGAYGVQQRANSAVSLSSTQSAPATHPMNTPSPMTVHPVRGSGAMASAVNLDYFPFDGSVQAGVSHNSSSTMLPPKKVSLPVDRSWEHLQYLDHRVLTYDTVEPTALNKTISNPETTDWTGDLWNLNVYQTEKPNVPQSLLSFSEESLTSGDEFVFSAAGSHNGSMSTNDGLEVTPHEEAFKGITMPVGSIEDELDFSSAIHT